MNSKISYVIATATVVLTLYACGGEVKKTSTETAKTATTNENVTATAQSNTIDGEAIFKKTCIACHQANGEGIANTFPPIAKSDFLANKENVIHQVIKGKTGEMTVNRVKYNSTMPPQPLSDEEVASVLTYVYNSFGNTGGAVTIAEVRAVREKVQ